MDHGLLQEADDAARRLGVSRSRLFVLAVRDFMERQRRERMLLRLNQAYAGAEPPEESLLNGIKAKVRQAVKP
jgi:hypothetical protein